MVFKTEEPQIVYNAQGRKTHVLLTYENYEQLLEHVKDIEKQLSKVKIQHQPDVPVKEVKKAVTKKPKRKR